MPRTLIESALPLEAINRRSVRESQGRISPLHLWWSHKPAAACRAAILASILDDRPDLLPLVARTAEAKPGDTAALGAAGAAVASAQPTVLDPFAGSAAIPAEAQRLGLRAIAADLNPVAVLMARALLEIPPRFAGRPSASGARAGGRLGGLIADLTHYGDRLARYAEARIGHHYPPGPNGAPVIAWLWARTLPCPNPACGRPMPLVHSFRLCDRPRRQAWAVPVPAPPRDPRRPSPRPMPGIRPAVTFTVAPADPNAPPPPDGTVNRRFARCVHCGETAPLAALRPHARRTGFGATLLAMVLAERRGRTYAPPDAAQEAAALAAAPDWAPDAPLPEAALGFATANWGLTRHRHLYSARQLLALTTFADGIAALRPEIAADARRAGFSDDPTPLRDGGTGAEAYAEGVSVYLALALDRAAAKWCTFARWHRTRENIEHPFASPGLHLLWDFAEANPFSEATGNWRDTVSAVARALGAAPAQHVDVPAATCIQADAADLPPLPAGPLLVCTDPPYFDTLPYADMADLFYTWLRPVLREIYPDIFETILCPKSGELVADPHRFGGTDGARRHFVERMRAAFTTLRERADPRYPLTVFYAFKEGAAGSGRAEGWEVILTCLLEAGLQVVGTWPLRTEHAQRLRARGSNTLASSVLLVCRPRAADAPTATRRDFTRELRRTLPAALGALTAEGVPPADLAQAAIGPGMAIFSRYRAVLEDGRPMAVGAALRQIGLELDAHLEMESGGLDAPTRFCLAWLEQHGFGDGPYGDAEMLARARDVSLEGLDALVAARGSVRLRGPDDPAGAGPSLWGGLHAMTRALRDEGVAGAARCLAAGSWPAADLRALARRLFAVCDARGEARAAAAYSAVVAAMDAVAAEAEGHRHAAG